MERFTLIVLCVGAVFLSVNGDVNADFDSDIDKILSKTKEVLIKYDEDLDKAVPFKELRASLTALDLMAKNYHGDSRDAIYEATNLGYSATTKYFQATDKIFTWCVKAKTLIGFIIENGPRKKDAAKSIHNLIRKGLEAVKESLDKLQEVRNELLVTGEKLRPVPGNLTIELEALKKEHLTDLQLAAKWSLKRLWKLIGEVVSIVKTFIVGQLAKIGDALRIRPIMIKLGIPLDVIEGKQAPSKDEEWKMTEAYYMSLIQAVNFAQDNVTAAWGAMNTEITQVGALHSTVEGYLLIIEDFPSVADSTGTQLKELRNTLSAFIDRHGGDKSTTRKKRGVFKYQGLDVEKISKEVDAYMGGTANQREMLFWSAQTLQAPAIQNYLIADLSKYSYLECISHCQNSNNNNNNLLQGTEGNNNNNNTSQNNVNGQ